MNEIFTLFCPPPPVASPISSWKAHPLPASGATLLFSTTFYPEEAPQPTSKLVTSLVSFWHTLLIKEIPYRRAPAPSPWTKPRQLHVPRLPSPAFSIPPPRQTVGPMGRDFSDFPLVADSEENRPEEVRGSAEILAQKTLPQQGTLKQEKDGSLYLEVSSWYHQEIVPLIDESNVELAPLKIPVVSVQEWHERQGLGSIPAAGEIFSFSVQGFYSLAPRFSQHIEKIWFLALDSPELQELRRRRLFVGMRPLFLTLAYKAAKKRRPRPSHPPLFRINVSCSAA